MREKQLWGLLFALVFMSYGTVAHAGWNFGIGTGPQLLNVSGDMGFDTALGAVDIDVDLDPDDLADVTESAIGLGGYATDGKWVIQFVVGKL
ncbi:MAG: hypothetical protein JRF28_09255, partial [Deltaproteobacteria bacterium]|nr:hypothetical protein [Deltaproteobacteria bacterium]